MSAGANERRVGGTARQAFEQALAHLDRQDVVERIWNYDASVWSDDPAVRAGIVDRLGWLDVAEQMHGEVDALAALSGKKSDEAARPSQAAESATAKPSAAEAKQCSTALPSNPQGHWSYRLIDGRKCWYQGENNFPKSLLQWSEQDISPHGFR